MIQLKPLLNVYDLVQQYNFLLFLQSNVVPIFVKTWQRSNLRLVGATGHWLL